MLEPYINLEVLIWTAGFICGMFFCAVWSSIRIRKSDEDADKSMKNWLEDVRGERSKNQP